MNTDKAYILGLVIGGGVWGNAEDVFRIRLPFKQWGSYEVNPKWLVLYLKQFITFLFHMIHLRVESGIFCVKEI